MQRYETDTGAYYIIHIRVVLDTTWSHWFGDLTITPCDNKTTILRGWIKDQTVLYGIIGKLRDLGLALISCVSERDVKP